MLVHPEHMVIGIIGEWGRIALQEVGGLRSPEFLPESFVVGLFENHWAFWLIFAVVAGVLWTVGRKRGDWRMMRAGEAAGGVLLLWVAAAYVVDTPRERLYRAHVGLAAAAKQGDVAGIVHYLAADFHSTALSVDTGGAAAAEEQIAALLKDYGVKGSTITAYHSDLSGRAAYTTLKLVTQTDIAGPVQSTWHLSWDDVAGMDWRVRDAELVKVGDEAVGMGRGGGVLEGGQVLPK